MKLKSKDIETQKIIAKITNIMAIIIVAAILIWGGITFWTSYKNTYTNDAQVTQYINPVVSRVGGYIVSVHYNDHQNVKRGDTLLVIDNQEYRYEADQVVASIQKEGAELGVLQSKKQILHEEHNALKESITAYEARVEKQQLEYNRYKYLFDEKSATAQQLEEVKTTLDVYKSELSSLRHKLIASQERVQDIDAQKSVLHAEKSRLTAASGRKKLDIGYTVILAPYDGKMGKRSIEKGQMIKIGEVLAYIVNKETPTWITANFKETQLRYIKEGDSASVEADAFPGKIFKGKIISISPATGSSFSLLPPDNATGNFVKIVQRIPVRVELNPDPELHLLRSGMNVNVSIPKNQN